MLPLINGMGKACFWFAKRDGVCKCILHSSFSSSVVPRLWPGVRGVCSLRLLFTFFVVVSFALIYFWNLGMYRDLSG